MGVDQGFGVRVLEDPLTNKGTAFSEEERSGLGLRGLLPAVVETLEQQVYRRYRAYHEQSTDIARHINLRALQDTNETLFYRLVSDHIEEMLPVLYTPTVGVACQRPFHRLPRPRPHRGDSAQPAPARGGRHRRHRRATDSGPG
jgi:malate dehydrogenase (oxaloacetate-decarboxylating)